MQDNRKWQCGASFVASMVAWMLAYLVSWVFNTYIDPIHPMPFQVAFIISAVVVLVANVIIWLSLQLIKAAVQRWRLHEITTVEPPQLPAPAPNMISSPVQQRSGRAGD